MNHTRGWYVHETSSGSVSFPPVSRAAVKPPPSRTSAALAGSQGQLTRRRESCRRNP